MPTGIVGSTGLLEVPTLSKSSVALFYGFIGGVGTWPHFLLPNFIGATLEHYYFQKRFSENR